MVRETRHLWVGNLPENVREEKIIEHFKRYGRVESVKVLPKRGSEGGVAAFVDFVDIKSAQKAHNAINKMGDRDLRTDYNEPGTIPSAARGLDDSLSLGSRGRDISGFTRTAGGAVYGPSASLHSRDGRYERRLDGTTDTRERAYDHSAYGHHERPGSSFERQRHYETDYYREARERTLSAPGNGSGTSSGSSTTVSSGNGGSIGVVSGSGTGGSVGTTSGVSGGSVSSGVGFYRSHSRSPCRFETPEPRYESRTREPFTLASVVHRDLYREDRSRRGERSYRHSRSRSPHSTHSRNPSPQRLASQATRPLRSQSGSRSRSRSSSSDSVSSTSSSTSGSDSSSSSSDDSPARSVQSAAVPAPTALPLSSLDKEEPRKSFGIKVQNLPVRSTDTSLKDGLFHEFKKHGKVTSVQIHGASEERYGLVFFRQQEDQEKALSASKGKLFFGMQIDVTAWNGPETESENEFRPLDERIDEFHPKATRTLFIGNLEKTTTYHDLLNIFQRFGEIVDIDIKKVNGAPQYAFLQYCDIASVCKAIKKMDGEYLGNNRLKLGFGKSMPTTCVWLDGLASNTTEQFLTRHFCCYGHVVKVVFDRMKGMALILYNNIEYAQAAVKDTKGWKIGGSKIKVDFANQESQMAFYRSMQSSGQDIRDFYDILSERREDRRSTYEFQTDRQYYENVRTTGTYTEDQRRKYTSRNREFYTEWDPYQGDYYETQYFEDPRDYREYRADPYEQDIRKYSYLQRERERERERFETDRGRDHGRRTIERSQSPSHITSRRAASPTASPSLSERINSDSDRRICCRSSERSGSCSSMSPPRFEKLEKVRSDRYIKADKLDKERIFEVERSNLVEKEKRMGRKERGDKDKSEKQRLKKLKVSSPVFQACEAESIPDRGISPEAVLQNKISKIPKENLGKGRLDLLPCVVQLTRVKEKEGKLVSHAGQDKQIMRCGSDSPRLASPPTDQRPKSPPFLSDQRTEMTKHGKAHREKNIYTLLDSTDKVNKVKSKKHGKSDVGLECSLSIDKDRSAARKRRFEDSSKSDRQKRTSEDDLGRLHRVLNNSKDPDLIRGLRKKEIHRDKCDHMASGHSPKEGPDCESSFMQPQLLELPDDSSNQLDSPQPKMDSEAPQSENCSNLRKASDDAFLDLDEIQEQQKLSENEQRKRKQRDLDNADDLFLEIDLANTCSKQIEQSRWHKAKHSELDSFFKYDNPSSIEPRSYEKDYMAYDVAKPVEGMTNEDMSCKRKQKEHFDYDCASEGSERKLCSSLKTKEDAYQRRFSSIDEEETAQISVSVTKRERKSPASDLLKSSSSLRPFHSPDIESTKVKMQLLDSNEEFMHRWETRIKSDSLRMNMSFPNYLGKHDSCKSQEQDLEPGEVQSDSEDDDDGESKHISSKSNRALSYVLREHEERVSDLKLSGSLEKNKFYSFALDKTITPDTKALLERAKTLYSSREDNWSFLPSRFPTSHSCTDKDKVELTPRPIPSWYKKKIRTNSDDKIHDKKEEHQHQDQERQELFASRFLHSSIFEQDSRRLQHLERKVQDDKSSVCRTLTKTETPELQPKTLESNSTQEPIVLFHSRFLELQQQKDKDLFPPDSDSITEETDQSDSQNCDNGPSDKMSDTAPNVEDKSDSPPRSLSVSPPLPVHKELIEVVTPSSNQPYTCVQEDKASPVQEVSESESSAVESGKPLSPKLMTAPQLICSETKTEPKTDVVIKAKIKDSVALDISIEKENLLSTSCALTALEGGNVESSSSAGKITEEISHNLEEKPIDIDQTICREGEYIDECLKNDTDSDLCMPLLEVEIKPLTNRRQPKSKRAKPLSILRSIQSFQSEAAEKPATRKSERIDKEKLKRASSPRAETPKTPDAKSNLNKSPINASDSDHSLESTLVQGRTRRRNVRSVYAKIGEEDQAGKDVVEPPRSMRKRGPDKDPIQQESQAPPTHARRGRPPKRGVKRNQPVAPVKAEPQKIIEGDMEEVDISVETEAVKGFEGWRSPRNQKLPPTNITKKASKTDKQSGITSPQPELTDQEESETKIDLEVLGTLSEKIESSSAPSIKKEKDLKDACGKKTVEGTESSERKLPEKCVKLKSPRLKRNSKAVTDDKSHTLKNLEIRVSVDDVKDLLRTENDEPHSFQVSRLTKTKALVQAEETKVTGLKKEAEEPAVLQDADQSLSEDELPVDPAAALLARQMELEQAVENIAKLTVEQAPRAFKEPPTEQPTLLPPVIVEQESEVEEEKRENPASETELAAAIDSITAEVTCTDTDGFTASPTYTPLISTPDSLVSPSSNEIMEPETHMVINNILAASSDDDSLPPSPKREMPETKRDEERLIQEAARRLSKVKPKTAPKKPRGRRGTANKRGDASSDITLPEPSPVKLPESIPDDPETVKSKATTITACTTIAASVVTAVTTCRRDVTSAITVNAPREAEHPEVEQPVPKESAFHSGPMKTPDLSFPVLAPANPQPSSQFNVPPLRPARMSLSPEWPPKSEESKSAAASCHVTVVTPTKQHQTSNVLGNPSMNPTMPPDTKASDLDTSSSTLRKILMEPKYVTASNSNSIHTTMVTSSLTDLTRMSENENPSDTVGSSRLYPKERSLPPQPLLHKPSPLTESQQNCGEKPQLQCISPATSVISRIPMPYDTEETPRISLSNRNTGVNIYKQRFRSNSNENSRYHEVAEDGVRGHSAVENNPYNPSTSSGLRLNTSEGVVVLSYSGQKTEGPHRMRAKISQIPQANAGDIEFQQSMSKSQLKQESPNSSSQSPSPKIASTSSLYGHTGVLLTNQSYVSPPFISSTNQESAGCDNSEALHHSMSQGGVVKMFQQPISSPQVLMYNQAVIQQHHAKRGIVTDQLPKKVDVAIQQSTRSPVVNHPPVASSHASSNVGDRSPHPLKQDRQSPQTTAHSTTFVKSSNSTMGTSVLSHGMPKTSTYHSPMHHSEQSSVIIQPHSITQSIAHETRTNTSHMAGMNLVRRSESISSPSPGPAQRSNTPQHNVIRDIVLKSHSSPHRSMPTIDSGGSLSEEDMRHFNQTSGRPPVSPFQTDLMMIHVDQRRHSTMRMDQYRDMHQRILMHQQLGDQAAAESRQARTSETSSNILSPSKSSVVRKSMEFSAKDSLKLEGKVIHQTSNESRIMGVHSTSPVMVSPHLHGTPLVHPGGTSSFPIYRDIRGFPSQFPGHPSGHVSNPGLTSPQVSAEHELAQRGKPVQSSLIDTKMESSHLRHTTSSELPHLSRMPGERVSPTYPSPITSPIAYTHKPDLSLQKAPPPFLPTTQSATTSQFHPDPKLEHVGHHSVDTAQLLTKYPIVWQGLLALKNDQSAVQLHFVSGNTVLAQRSLPPPEGGPLLRIVQRMRLEASQLDSVARRMTVENDYCLLLALPCGRDQDDVLNQTQALKSGFITYLQAKQAAGIINVPNPGSNQPAYVVQIFPPCEFSESHLSRLAPDLLNSIYSISPHLMIVIASV
ncbi:msx2-interacting protein isoform X1 [Synchiropus splendidus]|uniref:msx2-interacting protein isoform X1 n=2 Tax=Synchiropus splendidus TaxID=270530 RepID=UPI00237E0BAF|nr:msx2-interacting protein isoform X1 [Synchiropus splendidus]